MQTVTVLGTGMAGFGALHALRAERVACVCYDKNSYYGGHTATFAHPSGFLFDDGPHLSFTKNQRIQKLLADNVDDEYQTIRARINNYWRGYWLPHPAQCNLYGLPLDLQVDIIRDFVEVHSTPDPPIRNYADWLEAAYGKTFAHTFPMVYGLKYHTTSADNMSTEWLGPRMYRPDLREVLRGALAPTVDTSMHYVTSFRYPTRGGFAAYLRRFAAHADLRLSHDLVQLHPKHHWLKFANGVEVRYDALITSIPLPDLVARIVEVPSDVLAAAQSLGYTSVAVVNLGVDRVDLSEAHISYFYDPDVIFSRLNFPHMLSPYNVPAGRGSIQAEVYFSNKYRPLDRTPEALIDAVLRDLRRCSILREDDTVLMREVRVARYANVIFDLERAKAVQRVHDYLDEIGVRYCGRYGDWDHSWTDEAFVSGEQAAHAVLEGRRTAMAPQPPLALTATLPFDQGSSQTAHGRWPNSAAD